MKKQNKLNAVFIAIAAIFIGLACSGTEQTADASKLVDEANKKLDEAKEIYAKTETRNTKLFDVNVKTISQLQYYKAKLLKLQKKKYPDLASVFRLSDRKLIGIFQKMLVWEKDKNGKDQLVYPN